MSRPGSPPATRFARGLAHDTCTTVAADGRARACRVPCRDRLRCLHSRRSRERGSRARIRLRWHVGGSCLLASGCPTIRRSQGGDGLGPVYNDRSCLNCHDQGGAGGAGTADKNIELITPGTTSGPGRAGKSGLLLCVLLQLWRQWIRVPVRRPGRGEPKRRPASVRRCSPGSFRFTRASALRPAWCCIAMATIAITGPGASGCWALTAISRSRPRSGTPRRSSGWDSSMRFPTMRSRPGPGASRPAGRACTGE